MQTNFGSGASDHHSLDVMLNAENESMDRAISRLAASMLREAAIDMARGNPEVKKDAQAWINNVDAELPFDMCVTQVFAEDASVENIVDVVKEKIQSNPTLLIDAMSQYLTDVSERTIFSPKGSIVDKVKNFFSSGDAVDADSDLADQEEESASHRI